MAVNKTQRIEEDNQEDELTRKDNLPTWMDDLAVKWQEDERNLFGWRTAHEWGQGAFWKERKQSTNN